jgi:FixJ family two-component response regulator
LKQFIKLSHLKQALITSVKTLTCLLFDDEAESLQILTEIASKNSALSIKDSFTNPQIGLDYALKNPVDLIITDLNMPQVSGLELWVKLHQNSWFIFASGFPELFPEASGEKVIDTLHKPFSDKRFKEAIIKAKMLISEDRKKQKVFSQFQMLTASEKAIVLKIGALKESKEIAQEIHNSVKTIDRHRDNIRKKFGFVKPPELLLFAVDIVKYLDEL